MVVTLSAIADVPLVQPRDDLAGPCERSALMPNATAVVRNYRMASYVERELPGLIGSELPAYVARQSIMGHLRLGHR
jgi:hypothetical protein